MKGIAVFADGDLLVIIPTTNPAVARTTTEVAEELRKAGAKVSTISVSFAPGYELEDACAEGGGTRNEGH